jgi:hypothetical protein
MSHVVDRLLAQLPGLHGASDNDYARARKVSTTPVRYVTATGRSDPPTVMGLWGRVALGATAGVMMLAWPYFHDCGLPLFGYLLALLAIMGAGVWTAVMAWQLRSPMAHTVSLLVLFWGFLLVSSEVLPRTGYAAVTASWQCRVPDAGPSWMRWFGGPES